MKQSVRLARLFKAPTLSQEGSLPWQTANTLVAIPFFRGRQLSNKLLETE